MKHKVEEKSLRAWLPCSIDPKVSAALPPEKPLIFSIFRKKRSPRTRKRGKGFLHLFGSGYFGQFIPA